jgi:C4-dicarboxylate transporter/malic acid transport protein
MARVDRGRRIAVHLGRRQLGHVQQVVAELTPNWYASITGTAIVAVAAAGLPLQPAGLRVVATAVWALAAVLLVLLVFATTLHWARHPGVARRHHLHPVMSHFYGAPPMALLTVGAGTLLLGRDWIGLGAAVAVDQVLWAVGTALGLAGAVALPYLTFTRHDNRPDAAFGGWLMPIVPPMVSATTGALLVPHLPGGVLQDTMVWGCYAELGLASLCSVVIFTQIWSRLAQHDVGPAAMVPTLWIVLAPAGQSIAAAGLLAEHATTGRALLQVEAIVAGFAVAGFAVLWTTISGLVTIRAVRTRLPFSLTWWSFTFPVGACVLGFDTLARQSGSAAAAALAVVYFVGLVGAWCLVAVRTFHASVVTGSLRSAIGVAPAVR